MEKEEFDIVKQNIIDALNELDHMTITSPIDKSMIGLDLSDIGNHVGIAVGEIMSDKEGFDKEDFIRGFKHGISLTDGTH